MVLIREVIVLSPKKRHFIAILFMEIGIFFNAELVNAVVTSHSITLVFYKCFTCTFSLDPKHCSQALAHACECV